MQKTVSRRRQNSYLTAAEKTKSAKPKAKNGLSKICLDVAKNYESKCCNLLLLFVMHWQVSGREQNAHCNIKVSTYSYIFLSELKRNEKVENEEV